MRRMRSARAKKAFQVSSAQFIAVLSLFAWVAEVALVVSAGGSVVVYGKWWQ